LANLFISHFNINQVIWFSTFYVLKLFLCVKIYFTDALSRLNEILFFKIQLFWLSHEIRNHLLFKVDGLSGYDPIKLFVDQFHHTDFCVWDVCWAIVDIYVLFLKSTITVLPWCRIRI